MANPVRRAVTGPSAQRLPTPESIQECCSQAAEPKNRHQSRYGSEAVAEVYPAVALYRWGLPHRGYKGRWVYSQVGRGPGAGVDLATKTSELVSIQYAASYLHRADARTAKSQDP